MFNKIVAFITGYFSHILTVALFTLAAVLRSPSIAYASVVSLALVLGKDIYEKVVVARAAKNNELEETKKLVSSLNARITSIEYGIKTRGF